ncbi:MAG: hypothetical protein ACRDYY_07695, partial [Acidimicrobiales bacterium]
MGDADSPGASGDAECWWWLRHGHARNGPFSSSACADRRADPRASARAVSSKAVTETLAPVGAPTIAPTRPEPTLDD